MRKARKLIVGWCAIGALIVSLVPLHAAVAETVDPLDAPGVEVTPTPEPDAATPEPEDPADPEPDPDPEPEPDPTATPEPTPTQKPLPTETPTPEPTDEAEPIDPEDDVHEYDGPTMELTRELPERPMAATQRLAASYGPQPVFHFPWQPGKRWGASGSHADSDGIHRGAIDFAPLSSSAKAVRAVAAGTVYRVRCANGWFLGVDHGGGWMSEYYHLRGAKSGLIGKWVEAGTVLGYAGQTLPCGGTPGSSPHVHLSILNEAVDVPSGKRKYIPVSGIQFDRFVLRDLSTYYYGVWRDMAGKKVLTSKRVTCCLTASTRVGPSKPKASRPDWNGNGIDDRTEIVAWDTDLNSDGRPDIVGFGAKGVQTSLSRGSSYSSAVSAVSGFGTSTGWSTSKSLRMVIDVTGDGDPDIIGFRESAVMVAKGNGAGKFSKATRWASGWGYGDGWTLSNHIRTLADVNGDGRLDIVGIGKAGVKVALNRGSSFGPASYWLRGDFGSAEGWTTTRHVRLVDDVNGDGRADLIGFSKAGVKVALSTGSAFRSPTRWTSAFSGSRGWRADITPRTLADMNGDGRPDIVGFGRNGVHVALNTGSSFATAKKWSGSFGYNTSSSGWRVKRDPRTLADVNGDGRLDVVGLRSGGAYVARNTGSSFTSPALWTKDYGSREWTLGLMPRAVVDANGDGRADIVGFARHGVHVALSSGSRFGAAAHWNAAYGWGKSTGNWRVTTKPRGLSAG